MFSIMTLIEITETRLDLDLFFLSTYFTQIDPTEIYDSFVAVAEFQQPRPATICRYSGSRHKPLDCATFVFRDINEDQRSHLGSSIQQFFENPGLYLQNHGYAPVDDDLNYGDVVVYHPTLEDQLLHVGVYTGSGEVMSKWGPYTPVLIHRLDFVPSCFGSDIRYYRRECPKKEIL